MTERALYSAAYARSSSRKVSSSTTTSITIDDVEYPVELTTEYRTFERLPETPENLAKLGLR